MKKNHFNKSILALVLAQILIPAAYAANDGSSTGTGANSNYAQSPDNSGNLKDSLFNQAKFWHDKFQHQKASQALNRILLTDPNNEEALYYMALWASEINQSRTAKTYKDRLAKANPNSPYLEQLNRLQNMANLSTDQLNHARSLSQSGNISAAIAEYRKMFSGNVPPSSLVSEYYLTMAGDKVYYDRAVNDLVSYIKNNPNDVNAQITYGKILTYRKATLRKGIELLEFYSNRSQDADKALHQALLWLTPTTADEELYKRYAARHGSNTDVIKHYEDTIVGSLTEKAYSKRASDKKGSIEEFEKILAHNPNNQNALEALGYIYLEDKDYSKAADYLQRASEQGGSKAGKLGHDALMAKANFNLSLNNYAQANAIIDEVLASTPNDKDALFIKANVNMKQKNLSAAEKALNDILAQDSTNEGAIETLYYLYRSAGNQTKAKEILDNAPLLLRDKIIKATTVKAYVDPIPGIRRNAENLALGGNIEGAVDVLNAGVNKYPNSTWLHYDLAKYLSKQGYSAGSNSHIQYLTRNGASNEDLYAAAMLLNEQKQYAMALNAISRSGMTNHKAKALKEEILRNRTFSEVELYLHQGNPHAALNTLQSMNISPATLKTSQLGHLAYLYLKCGQKDRALDLANQAMLRSADPTAGIDEYADIVTVYTETGNYDKAREITNNMSILANSSAKAIDDLSVGDSIRKADALRELKRNADAYDTLYPLIQANPDSPALNMAMARLYQDNGMYDEAYTIYENVLRTEPNSQDALKGAINAAMSNKEYETATQLAQRLAPSDDPQTLTLMAKVDNKNKNYEGALAKLKRARTLLDGRYEILPDSHLSTSMTAPANTIVHQPGNPFSNRKASLSATNKPDQVVLPWTVNSNSAYSSGVNMKPKDRVDALNEVNFMIRDLQDKLATTVKIGVEANQKDGEEGLSKVNYMAVPVTLSTPVFDGAKLEMNVTPDSMYAGDVSIQSSEKWGTNALNIGLQNLVQRVNAIQTTFKADYEAALNAYNAQYAAWKASPETVKKPQSLEETFLSTFKNNHGLNNISDQALLALLAGNNPNQYSNLSSFVYGLNSINAASMNLTTEIGRHNLLAYLRSMGGEARNVLYAVNQYSNITTVMANAKVNRTSGVGFNLGLSDDNYKINLGVTPVGKHGTTLVGGVLFKYPVTQNGELRFNASRSAVKDSLLSYYGYKDELSGTYWGGVTKNGLKLEYGYDDGFLGGYLGGSYYNYKGKNVLSNKNVGLNGGLYVHPFKPTMYQDLTVGFDLNYEEYKYNENYFTFGHGGYFSPQKYFVASIPVNYKKKTENLELNANISLGYQNYHEDESPYYPTNADYQDAAEFLANYGFIQSAIYPAKDKSGIGGSAKITLDYYLLDDLLIGGKIGYNTFGEYKEMTEMLYIKSVLGGM
ncbi:Tetratricopeptide repeat-containing protein [Succinivibrio dextrinosolvens]|uniref:cellulose synthase subunit BcsC-related outer membrane protein n=1 Tax=Succinivibrio dextrinosolvens TaxID=83771 RepID=UPI0008E075B9|nr:cellulose synthase subunit BcsC-related outer membrane protein [Succinivibrio dextrinosolvens]SFS44543.1 Tetratricopeptide repeat-containing protein [Succinivibrio dextrinosolvens]